MFNRSKKWLVGLGLSLMLSVQLLAMFTPLPARAIVGAPDVVAALTGKWSKDAIMEGVLASSLGALVNGFSYFMRKLAYDSAVWIAHGGKGQGALVFQQSAGDYFSSVALDSAASAIEEFGQPFGLSLCRPPDLQFQIFLQVSLRKLYADPSEQGGPQPDCRWNDFQANWENGFDNFDEKAGDFASQMFSKSLKVDQSDMGIALGFIGKVDQLNTAAEKKANTERLEGGGFKAVTDLVTGNIKTPADVIREETKALTGKDQKAASAQQIAGIYGAGLWQVIPAAAGVFLNTLVSQFMDQVFNGGLFPDPGSSDPASGGGAAGIFNEYAGVINNNKAAAENAFSFLFTAVPTQQLTTYPLIEEFSDCSNPDNPGLNNCVADPGLVQAVKQAKAGKRFTIREAVDRKNNLLHADWVLVPPQHEINSDPRKCYNGGYYCYSNLQKLRKARILPLGFEIAASKVDPDQLQNYTLEKIVSSFYDCNANGEPDTNHPFCHLIDPEWIIRLPEPRCEAKVFGPKLLSADSAERRQECADVSTCLMEDDKGNCISNYGYCLREQNTWRFGGSSCPEQFNTCTAYTNLKDNTRVSYLSRTLQVGQCDAGSVGCQVYSVKQSETGQWQQGGSDVEIKGGFNKTIHFNESIKNYSCPASAEGCSAVFRVDGDGTKGDVVYLKKAPAALFEQCYIPKLGEWKWPENDGEIEALAARPTASQCSSFAPACTKNDVGCDAYKPADGGDTVTGIVGSNQCASSCIGYDTFKQEQPENKGAFEPAVFPLQFIPTQAQSCSPQYEGCSEFTNIDTANAGGEKLEYYSDLIYCEKPDSANQKVFYSWEGTVNEGYVLRTHKLRTIASQSTDRYSVPNVGSLAAKFPAGSPAYVDWSLDSMSANNNECNETTYTAAVQNPYGVNTAKPDCRALYDDTGAIFYRLLSKTVVISDACHPIRKTESFLRIDPDLTQQNSQNVCVGKGGKWTGGAGSKCEVCYNGGLYQNGACVYMTTSQPTDAKSCPQTANNCRAFTGKGANNTQTVLEQKFEPANSQADALANAKAGWETGTIKPESITVGQYSLELQTGISRYAFVSSTLEKDKFYELEFWSRGKPQNLDIYFIDKSKNNAVVGRFTLDPVTNQNVKVPISSTWQAYRLGPIQFTGDGADNIALVVESSAAAGQGNGAYYLDNLRLTKVKDKLFLIKNSWKRTVTMADGSTYLADAPLTCDADPKDGRPGSALGCRAYTTSVGDPIATTGFDRLCKAAAVGCSAFLDTNNTVNETGTTAYNLWCAGPQNTTCDLKAGTTSLGTCQVPPGQTGCYIKKAVVSDPSSIPSTAIKSSTQVIPRDGWPLDPLSGTTMYLAYRKAFACGAENLGCQKVAARETLVAGNQSASAAKYNETFVRNNPENYGQILCASEQIGCGSFKSNNSVSYFKDPTAAGAPICVYRDAVKIGATTYSGWFQEGIGKCSNSSAVCKQDSDCGSGGSCPKESIGTVPCDSTYVTGPTDYGIWSNNSPSYKGAAGRCAEQYNQCTEIVDTADTSDTYEKGKPYYVIYDQRLQNNVGQCDGKANLKNGCVLFNVTSNPTKLFNTAETYMQSDGLNIIDKKAQKAVFNPVTPISTATGNDANVLLKVERDRSCSEWLACKDKVRVTDQNGKQKTVCTQYKACRSTSTGEECRAWSPTLATSQEILDAATYTSRDVSWYGEDYSGYSLYKKFQFNNFLSLTFEGDNTAYLVSNDQTSDVKCQNVSDNKDANWATKCGQDEGGRCAQKKCVFPISGVFPSSVDTKAEAIKYLDGGICKAFPESTSPYASTVSTKSNTFKSAVTGGADRQEFVAKLPGLEGANICQNGECSCEYQKVTYKSGTTDYYKFPEQKYPAGVCSGGDRDGQTCALDSDCSVYSGGNLVSAGVCSQVKDVQTQIGLRGFCLEYDYSRPINRARNEYACLTWLPVDSAASVYDNFNQYPEAGYYPAIDAATKSADGKVAFGGQVYCTEATANFAGVFDNGSYTWLKTDASAPSKNLEKATENIETLPLALRGSGSNTWEKWKYGFYPSTSNHKPDNARSVSATDYAKLLYTTMQSFAWSGDAYRFNNNPKDVTSMSGGFNNLLKTNAVVTYLSALPYQYYFNPTVWGRDYLAQVLANPTNYLVPNYSLGATILEPEIGVLHYGPILTPNFNPFIITIENEYLKKLVKKKGSAGELEYSYTKTSSLQETNVANPTGIYKHQGQYNNLIVSFRVTIDSGVHKGKVILGSVALADSNGEMKITNEQSFADSIIKEFMDNNPIDQGFTPEALTSVKNWLSEEATNRSAFIVKNIYGVDGKRISHGTPYSYEEQGFPGKYTDLIKNFDGKQVKIYLAEITELVPRCVQFAEVYNATDTQNTNKAWTNRTWYYSKYQPVNWFTEPDIYSKETLYRPYGSTLLDSTTYLTGEYYDRLRNYVFSEPLTDAIFLSCKNTLPTLQVSGKTISTVFDTTQPELMFNNIKYLSYGFGCKSDSFYHQDALKNLYSSIRPKPDQVSGMDRLKSFFIKTFKLTSYTDLSWTDPKNNTTSDDAGIYQPGLLPPQIYSLDITKCFGSSGVAASTCTPKEANAFTVNRRNGTAEEDADKDGLPDPILRTESLTVTTNFFAFADQDRMPIKRIMVDWGDGTTPTNQNRTGSYKNHKPFCMSAGDESTGSTSLKQCSNAAQLTCRSDQDCPTGGKCNVAAYSFGNTPRACTPEYFEFIHGYSCGAEDLATKQDYVFEFGKLTSVKNDANSALINGEKIWAYMKSAGKTAQNTPYVCIFKPKVQVTDNWGWCTGSCEDENGNIKPGCYENRKTPLGIDEQCKSDSLQSFIKYKGAIVVTPPS